MFLLLWNFCISILIFFQQWHQVCTIKRKKKKTGIFKSFFSFCFSFESINFFFFSSGLERDTSQPFNFVLWCVCVYMYICKSKYFVTYGHRTCTKLSPTWEVSCPLLALDTHYEFSVQYWKNNFTSSRGKHIQLPNILYLNGCTTRIRVVYLGDICLWFHWIRSMVRRLLYDAVRRSLLLKRELWMRISSILISTQK